MSRKLKVALVAGEASGDTLGAGLIAALKQRHPDIEFAGIGGEKMIAEGLNCRAPMERLSVMGITEVLGRLFELVKLRRNLAEWFIAWQPDIFIGIDAPDFNLGLEQTLRQANVKTVHYVSPSVWAWRKGRLKKIRRSVDHMLTLLPFEADFYQHESIPVTFVGHTLADAIPMHPEKPPAESFGLDSNSPILAVLPGSRSGEIEKLLQLFIATAEEVGQTSPGLQIVIPAANQRRRQQIDQILSALNSPLKIKVLDQQADQAIAISDAVLVASGTATLQTMLLKKPMVVAYRMSPVSFWLISKLATTRWVSLPNILEQRAWVPERLQDDATVEQLAEDVKRALADDAYRAEFVQLAEHWHQQLALSADERAAEAVLSLVK